MARPRLVEESELLDAAMAAFWRGGYGGVSTRALEEATGLSASSLYHRYGSKEGLFTATLSHYIERIVAGRIGRYLQQDEALAGLRGFFTSVYRTRDASRACLLANTWNELGTRLPAVTAVLVDGNRRLRGAFVDALRRGMTQGTLRTGLDADVAAGYLLTALQGLLLTARVERDQAALDAQVELILGALRT